MQHKHTTKLGPTEYKHYPVRDELLALAIKATKKFNGVAMIDNRYAIVDTDQYKIMPKK